MHNPILGRALTLVLILGALPMAVMADVPVVPELNPSTAGSAITILVGMGLVLRSRRRR